jgi:hypothetical protein
MKLGPAAQALGALGVCTVVAVGMLYVTKSAAQTAKEAQPQSNASPIYGVTIPPGYRGWSVISVGHLADAGGKLKQLRAQ